MRDGSDGRVVYSADRARGVGDEGVVNGKVSGQDQCCLPCQSELRTQME